MDYNALGKTGLEVWAVSFGTSPLGDMLGEVSASRRANDICPQHGVDLAASGAAA
jgi:hypothetical protein